MHMHVQSPMAAGHHERPYPDNRHAYSANYVTWNAVVLDMVELKIWDLSLIYVFDFKVSLS